MVWTDNLGFRVGAKFQYLWSKKDCLLQNTGIRRSDLEEPLGSGDMLLKRLLIRSENKNTLNCTIRKKPVIEGQILVIALIWGIKNSQAHRSGE